MASDRARPIQQHRVDAYAALSRCARFSRNVGVRVSCELLTWRIPCERPLVYIRMFRGSLKTREQEPLCERACGIGLPQGYAYAIMPVFIQRCSSLKDPKRLSPELLAHLCSERESITAQILVSQVQRDPRGNAGEEMGAYQMAFFAALFPRHSFDSLCIFSQMDLGSAQCRTEALHFLGCYIFHTEIAR